MLLLCCCSIITWHALPISGQAGKEVRLYSEAVCAAGVILCAFFVSGHAFVFGAVSFGFLSWKKVQLTDLAATIAGILLYFALLMLAGSGTLTRACHQ
jgi:hypothetical protein